MHFHNWQPDKRLSNANETNENETRQQLSHSLSLTRDDRVARTTGKRTQQRACFTKFHNIPGRTGFSSSFVSFSSCSILEASTWPRSPQRVKRNFWATPSALLSCHLLSTFESETETARQRERETRKKSERERARFISIVAALALTLVAHSHCFIRLCRSRAVAAP